LYPVHGTWRRIAQDAKRGAHRYVVFLGLGGWMTSRTIGNVVSLGRLRKIVKMEVVLGFLLLFGITGLAFRSKRSKPKRPTLTYAKRRTSRPDRSSFAKPKSPVQPFDPENACHLGHVRTVSGPAWIVDGDTIKVKNTQIRLYGIDAPELHHPYGKNAKWALHRLCKGHTVRAEITDIDNHGRTVARCFLADGRDLSAEMVKQGLAIDWPKYSGGIYKKLETSDARKRLFLADARQKGRMHVWKKFEART